MSERGSTMKAYDPAVFHKMYGVRKPRIAYFSRDFLDYAFMIGLSGLVLGAAPGWL